MCLWCEVEERVYYSYQDQERKALDALRRIEEDPQKEGDGDSPGDQLRCIWEKKLEYITARMLRERLAVEMADAELCGGEEIDASPVAPRHFPAPSVPPHLLAAFERYVESLFDRLTRAEASRPDRGVRKLVPFPPPDPAS